MLYKILIEPAKSDKSTCKNCGNKIDKDTIRAKVVDAREFNACIKRHGRQNLSGEGLSRGYFECAGPNGETISIQKYFVHLDCYEPIEPHPFESKYFDLKGMKKNHKETFNQWLSNKVNSKKTESKKNEKSNTGKTQTKTKATKKEAKTLKPQKTKKILKQVNKPKSKK